MPNLICGGGGSGSGGGGGGGGGSGSGGGGSGGGGGGGSYLCSYLRLIHHRYTIYCILVCTKERRCFSYVVDIISCVSAIQESRVEESYESHELGLITSKATCLQEGVVSSGVFGSPSYKGLPCQAGKHLN